MSAPTTPKRQRCCQRQRIKFSSDGDSDQYKRFPPIGGSKSQQDLIDAYYFKCDSTLNLSK